MNRKRIAFFLLLCVIISAAGCIGMHTRNYVLLPAMQVAWDGVRADAETGGADADVLTQFTAALTAKDQTTIIALWPAIKISVESGLADLPAGLKAAKQERLTNFDEAVTDLSKHVLF